MPEQLQRLLANLQALGPRRLAVLGAAGLLMVLTIVFGSIYLHRPSYEALYVGLERSDVNQIGMVLGEAGIEFDVAADGTSVLVPVGKTARARMLLAEKGLPTSTNAGYELFDNVGSLGLTSFMQEITRIRALEGEIARTIQSIAGIKAARVHIVLAERANFRRENQNSTASVVIRTDNNAEGMRSAAAIRQLVSAAVPGLNAEHVTVLDSAGNLLASGDDPANSTATRALNVERAVETQIEDNIRRALSPYLGADNFRASVKAEVNTDSRQTEETIFDPESRVERSTQTVRTLDNSRQNALATPTTVEQNLPEEQPSSATGPQSSQDSERKEEVTNYEMNSKKIATISNGYDISKLSIGVVVNRARLAAVIGENASPEQIAERIAMIEKMVASSTGLNATRGDIINVSAVEFIDALEDGEFAGPTLLDRLGQQTGTLINAGAFVLVAFLITWFGVKPMIRAILPANDNETQAAGSAPRALPDAEASAQIAAADAVQDNEPNPLEDLRQRLRPPPQERLARLVELNEEKTAQILRKWAAEAA